MKCGPKRWNAGQNDGMGLAKPIPSGQNIGHAKFREFGAPLRPDSVSLAPIPPFWSQFLHFGPGAEVCGESELKTAKFRGAEVLGRAGLFGDTPKLERSGFNQIVKIQPLT